MCLRPCLFTAIRMCSSCPIRRRADASCRKQVSCDLRYAAELKASSYINRNLVRRGASINEPLTTLVRSCLSFTPLWPSDTPCRCRPTPARVLAAHRSLRHQRRPVAISIPPKPLLRLGSAKLQRVSANGGWRTYARSNNISHRHHGRPLKHQWG